MSYYLLLSRSITHAQRMSSVLGKAGINHRLLRPPLGLTDKGCSYAVRVVEPEFWRAVKTLKEAELLPVRVFFTTGDGVYREILPH